ncbi:MAG: hypothetical protein QM496_08130 [Verrucomicrobiota bacterium]
MTSPQTKKYASNLTLMSFYTALVASLLLFPGISRANDTHTHTTEVTIHAYYGEAGEDGHGGHVYKAKVVHGHHNYFIYLHQPLPQLASHIHAKAHVSIANNTDRWMTISIDGHSAKIHKVVKIHHD